MKRNKAFTILELLIVIAIIAILAVLVVPNFIGDIEKSRDARNIAEINSVNKAVSMYYADHGYIPTLQGDQPTYGDPKNIKFAELVPQYLDKLPHFSYWYIDYEAVIYHTEYSVGNVTDGKLQTNANYTYKLYKNGQPQNTVITPGSQVTLNDGEALKVTDSKGTVLPDLANTFKGTIAHPEAVQEEDNNPPVPQRIPIDITSLKFPGDVTIPNQSYIHQSNYTIEFRIKVTSNAGTQGVMAKGAMSNREFYIDIASGSINYFVYNSARVPEGVASSVNIYDNNWHQMAITNEWKDSGDLLTMYIDGTQVAQKQTSIHQSISSNPLTLGDVAAGDGRKLNGCLDEVRLWSVVRTPTQIKDNKDYELNGDEEGLVSYYNMNEGSGTIVHDKTSNQNHASVGGTTWFDKMYITPSTNVGKVYATPEAGWNRYDNTSAGITYKNMILWTTTDTNNFFYGNIMGDGNASIPIGATASTEFKMTGTQFRLLVQCYSPRNEKIKVYVDGVYTGWFTAPQTLINGHVCYFESGVLPEGTHTIRLEHINDGAGQFLFDGLDIKDGTLLNDTIIGKTLTDPETGWTRIEDNNALIVYGSGFTRYTGPSYTGTGITYSSGDWNAITSNINFSFSGTKLRIILSSHPTKDYGYNNTITIDGVTYSLYKLSAGEKIRVAFDITGLEDKVHTATININSSIFGLDAIDLSSSSNLVSFTSKVPKITGNSSSVLTNSTSASPGYCDPWMAFDSRTMQPNWYYGTQLNGLYNIYLGWDFGTPTVINAYSIYTACGAYRAPKNFVFQGSDDLSTWVDLDTRNNESFTDGVKRYFTFQNTHAYRAYRVYSYTSGAVGTGYNYTLFGDLAFYEAN